MCGICGIVKLSPDREFSREALQAMADSIRHRGPDDHGNLVSWPVGFGFRRLSIIDLATGHQPMSNEDGTLWIVFNGEIYNHPELRPQLERRGHKYATDADTETILHLYEDHGEDCVHHLRGMFGFAIFDTRRNRLFCARDRLGIKPFYYVNTAEQFGFASEIKALFELPGVRPELNSKALPEFFTLGYISSDETMFAGVRKLLPGHRLTLAFGNSIPELRIEKYWDLDMTQTTSPLSETEHVNLFRELFDETVRIHLMSDVPLGVFLSGGLDSSAIAATMASMRQDRIQTFSVGYAEDKYSELPYARIVAEHIGAEYNEVIVGPEDFFASLPQLIWHEDEPIVWPSSVSLHFVSQLASQKVKVVLSGEGGDEIFAGYLKYRATLWNMLAGPVYRGIVPDSARSGIRKLLASGAFPDYIGRKLRHSFLYHPETFEKLYFDNFYSVFPQDEHSRLLTEEVAAELVGSDAYANSMQFFSSTNDSEGLLKSLLYLDIKTYLVELLMKQDQMSMSTSLESRVPFLDHKFVEFAMSLPANLKVRKLSGKYILRKAMSGRLPQEVLSRTKKGFPTPIRPWLRQQLYEKVRSILTDGRLEERKLIKPAAVQELLEKHRCGSSSATEGCWRLLNFELWCRIFFDGESVIKAERSAVARGISAA
jgi:asparagine synthase (glutamine-hydrolysing)